MHKFVAGAAAAQGYHGYGVVGGGGGRFLLLHILADARAGEIDDAGEGQLVMSLVVGVQSQREREWPV